MILCISEHGAEPLVSSAVAVAVGEGRVYGGAGYAGGRGCTQCGGGIPAAG